MASISQAQEKLLSSTTNFGGIDKGGEIKLTEVESVMFEAANKFLQLAIQRINQKGKVDTGNLSDMIVSPTKIKDGKVEITIGYEKSNPASKYYDYQNKGVRGIVSKQPATSPYSYKKLGVSKAMVEAILQWYLRHKNYIKNEDQRKNLTSVQRKRKTLAKAADPIKKLKQVATNTAKSIKKKGLARIGFFDDNLSKAFGEDFQKKLATALGQDVALTIKYTFNGNNSTK